MEDGVIGVILEFVIDRVVWPWARENDTATTLNQDIGESIAMETLQNMLYVIKILA